MNQDFMNFITSIKNKSSLERLMCIDIFVDDDDEMLKQLYVDAAKKHNQKTTHHSSHIEELGSAYEQTVSSGAKNNHPAVTLSRMKSEK